jgi:polyhydroxyalkanoate synthesis regulator phasin
MRNFFKNLFKRGSRLDLVARNIELEDRLRRSEDMCRMFQELYNNATARESQFARSSKQFEEMYLDAKRELVALRAVSAEQDRLIDILRRQVEALSK